MVNISHPYATVSIVLQHRKLHGRSDPDEKYWILMSSPNLSIFDISKQGAGTPEGIAQWPEQATDCVTHPIFPPEEIKSNHNLI